MSRIQFLTLAALVLPTSALFATESRPGGTVGGLNVAAHVTAGINRVPPPNSPEGAKNCTPMGAVGENHILPGGGNAPKYDASMLVGQGSDAHPTPPQPMLDSTTFLQNLRSPANMGGRSGPSSTGGISH